MGFNEALSYFKKTGRFELTDEMLCVQHLHRIKGAISNFLLYQFYFENITLVLNESDLENVRVALSQRDIVDRQQGIDQLDRIAFAEALNEVEGSLFELFCESKKWEIIELNYVTFYSQGVICHLSQNFFVRFFRLLISGIHNLKQLSIQGTQCSPHVFVSILSQNQKLSVLRSTMNTQDAYSFRSLMTEIMQHPGMRELDLLNTALYKADYLALSDLLFTNYRIEKIHMPMPKAENLQEAREELMQRLAQTPYERFVNEQLNQNELLNLVKTALIDANHDQFALLLKQVTDLSKLTSEEKKTTYLFLPAVYHMNVEHLETDWSLIQLDIETTLDLELIDDDLREYLENAPPKSIGRYLLEIAIAYQDVNSIRYLLAAGANVLEASAGPSLLAALLEAKTHEPWANLLLEHIQKEWSVLVPKIVYLKPFPSLYVTLTDIKRHLNSYLILLLKRIQLPLPWSKLYRVEARKKEWENTFFTIAQLIEKATRCPKIRASVISEMYEGIGLLLDEARKANSRMLFAYSGFNTGIEKLGVEVQTELRQLGKRLEDSEQNPVLSSEEDVKIAAQVQRLEAKLKKTEETLKYEREMYVQDKQNIEAIFTEKMQAQAAGYQLKLNNLEQKLNSFLMFFSMGAPSSVTPPEDPHEAKGTRFFQAP